MSKILDKFKILVKLKKNISENLESLPKTFIHLKTDICAWKFLKTNSLFARMSQKQLGSLQRRKCLI